MRYLVKAKLKPQRERELLQSIEQGTLGQGSVAGDEYLRNMSEARACDDGSVRWVEVCYCPTPLEEEREYWEEFFELTRVQDAHLRKNCRDENGSEAWACDNCDCTRRLEERMQSWGCPFLPQLKARVAAESSEAAQ
jgi:hypothetical protein